MVPDPARGATVLFLHETHKVVGTREDDFEAAYREGWMPTLAQGDGSAWRAGPRRETYSRGCANWTTCVTT
jgi:hypothetical protein